MPRHVKISRNVRQTFRGRRRIPFRRSAADRETSTLGCGSRANRTAVGARGSSRPLLSTYVVTIDELAQKIAVVNYFTHDP